MVDQFDRDLLGHDQAFLSMNIGKTAFAVHPHVSEHGGRFAMTSSSNAEAWIT